MCIYIYTPIVKKHVFMILHIVGVSSVKLTNIKDMKFKPKTKCDTPLGGTKVTAIAFHVRPMLLLC